MSQQVPPQDPEDARKDLLATLAASRELGPEMDHALVDSFLDKHSSGPGSSASDLVPQSTQKPEVMPFSLMVVTGLAFAAYIVLLIVSSGRYWWMFWLPMAVGGWWASTWQGTNSRHAARDEYRRARYEYRRQALEARMQRRAQRHGYTPQPPATPPTVEPPQRPDALL